jgi:hypothetical protein
MGIVLRWGRCPCSSDCLRALTTNSHTRCVEHLPSDLIQCLGEGLLLAENRKFSRKEAFNMLRSGERAISELSGQVGFKQRDAKDDNEVLYWELIQRVETTDHSERLISEFSGSDACRLVWRGPRSSPETF